MSAVKSFLGVVLAAASAAATVSALAWAAFDYVWWVPSPASDGREAVLVIFHGLGCLGFLVWAISFLVDGD